MGNKWQLSDLRFSYWRLEMSRPGACRLVNSMNCGVPLSSR